MKNRIAVAAFIAAVVAGGLLRFTDLPLRPLHHDEGVNALFLLDLINDGTYQYDPSNYHGPLLYYMVAALIRLFGDSTVVLRLWPAIIGTLTVALVWPLRSLIGTTGAVVAAWLVALSPVSVFFSRDLIHEAWFAGAGMLLLSSVAVHLRGGRPGFIVLAWLAVALLFGTKETAPLVIGALVVGGVAAGLLVHGGGLLRRVWTTLGQSRSAHAWGVLASALVLVLLYTADNSWRSFTDNGLVDLVRSYTFWTETGTGPSGHEKPWPYFFDLLWRYETITFSLGIGGLALALVRRELAAGIGLSAGVFLTAHAAIPYKTPWLILACIPWLAASAGYLVDRAVEAVPKLRARAVTLVVVAALMPGIGIEAHRLSFIDYDADSETVVYSQTVRGFMGLVEALLSLADASPTGRKAEVDVMSSDHFPLNWYTRDFSQIGYPGTIAGDSFADIAIVSEADLEDLAERLEKPSHAHAYPLRPGVTLALVATSELFDRARADIPDAAEWEDLGSPRLAPGIDLADLPGNLARGLRVSAFVGGDFSQPGTPVAGGNQPSFDFEAGKGAPWTTPHGMEWTGYLRIPKEIGYRFALESDDGSTLEIGDTMVIDNSGRHSLRRRTGFLRLAAGFHRIRIRYTDFGGGAHLRLKWAAKDGSGEVLVPQQYLSH